MLTATQTATVLDALVLSLRTALPGVEVVDGQPTSQQLNNPDVLLIGFSPSQAAVEITQERQDLGGRRRQEALSIVCLASAWRGETDMAPVRTRAVEIVESVRVALNADRTLGGAVFECILGFDMTLDQAQTADGATATVEFTLMVRAL